jgi:hypothetical protein
VSGVLALLRCSPKPQGRLRQRLARVVDTFAVHAALPRLRRLRCDDGAVAVFTRSGTAGRMLHARGIPVVAGVHGRGESTYFDEAFDVVRGWLETTPPTAWTYCGISLLNASRLSLVPIVTRAMVLGDEIAEAFRRTAPTRVAVERHGLEQALRAADAATKQVIPLLPRAVGWALECADRAFRFLSLGERCHALRADAITLPGGQGARGGRPVPRVVVYSPGITSTRAILPIAAALADARRAHVTLLAPLRFRAQAERLRAQHGGADAGVRLRVSRGRVLARVLAMPAARRDGPPAWRGIPLGRLLSDSPAMFSIDTTALLEALVDAWSAVLERVRADVLVTGNDRHWAGLVPVEVCRLRGIPTLAVQDAMFGDNATGGFLAADHMAVAGDYLKDVLVRRGVSPGRLHVTGLSRFDALPDLVRRPVDRRDVMLRLGLPWSKRLVVLATDHSVPA